MQANQSFVANAPLSPDSVREMHELYKFALFANKNWGKMVFGAALSDNDTGLTYLESELIFSDPVQAYTYGKILFKLPKDINRNVDDEESDDYYYHFRADDYDDSDSKGYLHVVNGVEQPITQEEYETVVFRGLDMFSPVRKQAVLDYILPERFLVDEMGGEGKCSVCYYIICENGKRKDIEPKVMRKYVKEHNKGRQL